MSVTNIEFAEWLADGSDATKIIKAFISNSESPEIARAIVETAFLRGLTSGADRIYKIVKASMQEAGRA